MATTGGPTGRRRRRPQRLDPSTAQIAIVGSGLAGLATAISLEQRGFVHVTIYERDVSWSARKDGYGLTLTYHPTGILQQLGVLDALANEDCPSRSHYLFDSNGSILGYFGNLTSSVRGQRGNLRVPRQRVRQILMEQLQTTKICWNHPLVGLEETATAATVGTLATDEDNSDSNGTTVDLHFACGTSTTADLVIGADGIRSTVVQLWIPNAPSPRSLGVHIILGLTRGSIGTDDSSTEQLRERGFYTLRPGLRLFVMPYQGSLCGTSYRKDEPVRIMWQLSYSDEVLSADTADTDGTTTRTFNADTNGTVNSYHARALRLTQGWHTPVQALIRATPCADVWGTLLHDRDPVALAQHLNSRTSSRNKSNKNRVLLCGDALHAMSPFKGQGANQCLRDGKVVADWLVRANVTAAVKGSLREMVQRTAPIVAASRAAAAHWHHGGGGSDDGIVAEDTAQQHTLFAGVKDPAELVRELKQRGVTADCKGLDETIWSIVNELQLGSTSPSLSSAKSKSPTDKLSRPQQQALVAASTGDLGTLRRLSWEGAACGTSECLHAALAGGHARTVHWLVTEAGCDLEDVRTPNSLDATKNIYDSVVELVERLEAASLRNTAT